jgi:hypothetical protein
MREGQADTSAERRRAMLRSAMGPAIADALADPLVVEIMVNPDGRLWLDRLGEDASIPASCARRPRPNGSSGWSPAMPGRGACRCADHLGGTAAARGGAGERFEGLLPRSPARLALPSASQPPAFIGSPTMSMTGSWMRPWRTPWPKRLAGAATSWWWAAPARARPRWPMRFSRRWPIWKSG